MTTMKKLFAIMEGNNQLAAVVLNENAKDTQSEFNEECGLLLYAVKRTGDMDAYRNLLDRLRYIALSWVSASAYGDEDEDENSDDDSLDFWTDEMQDWVRSIDEIAADEGVELDSYRTALDNGSDAELREHINAEIEAMYADDVAHMSVSEASTSANMKSFFAAMEGNNVLGDPELLEDYDGEVHGDAKSCKGRRCYIIGQVGNNLRVRYDNGRVETVPSGAVKDLPTTMYESSDGRRQESEDSAYAHQMVDDILEWAQGALDTNPHVHRVMSSDASYDELLQVVTRLIGKNYDVVGTLAKIALANAGFHDE